MHGQDLLLGQQVIHDGEDGFFDFTGVLGTSHQDHFLGEIDDNENHRAGAIHFGDGVEVRGVDDGEGRDVFFQISVVGLNEHVAGKQTVPGVLGDNPYRHAVVRIRPGKTILHKEVLALQVSQETVMQGHKLFRGHRFVDVSPPDLVLAGGFPDDELVIGSPAGVFPGAHHDGSQVGQATFPAADDFLV